MDSEKLNSNSPETQENENSDSSCIYYKSPLGMQYTELEEIRYQRAIREAKKYMRNFGKGNMPLVDGYATKRKRPHKG